MIKKGIKGLVLAGALASGPVVAELSYNYAEAGLGIWDADGGQTLIGPDVRGSFLINENIFAFGGLRFLTDDVDYTNLYFGGGYRHALDAKTDIWGGLNLEYQEFDVDNCSGCGHDDTAPAIRGGVRHQVNGQVEIGASARFVTGDYDYLGLTGQGRYKIQQNLSLTGEVDIQDGDLGLFGGVTFLF